MINIVNVRSKRLYQAEFNRQMITLENTFLRELRPLLGRQFFNAAALVQANELNAVDHAVDLPRMRLVRMFRRHYKRVAASFSRKAYKILDKSQGKSIESSEIKSPKDEFWLSMNKWSRRQTATKIRGIQTTTKKVIAKIIRRGQSDGESHREIAKRIRKTSAAINPHRARTIALTETHGASVKSVDVAIASTRIEMEREWVSAKDLRTRTRGLKNPWEHYKSFPRGADGEKVAQDGLFKGTGQALRFPGDPRGSAGNIIRCLASSRTLIFTDKGWKQVRKIKKDDLVLTHKNRFKKVLRISANEYEGDIIKIIPKAKRPTNQILVTPEHPFLMADGKWKEAQYIKKGDFVKMMCGFCGFCGKTIPYWNKYCNISCSSKKTTERQWRDPEHRKNISKKASAQMKREYANGTRDRFEITKKARKVHFDKWGPGGSFGVLVKTPEFQKKRLQVIEKKYGSVLNMLKKFAFPALGKVNYSGSKIEQAMAAFLDKNDRSFVSQFLVGRRRIDFYIKTEKLFIEVDGYPFHEDKEGERKRDLEILTQYPDHQIVHVDYKLNPPKWEFFDLVALNHTKTYDQIDIEIGEVIKKKAPPMPNGGLRKVYNFAVEDDESYVARGFVTHNCRCVLIYHSVKRTQDLKPYEPEESFLPAKTINEAESWIKDNNIAKNVLYSGGRMWGAKKTKEATLEKFNAIGKEIDEFQKRHNIKLPEVKNFYVTNSGRGKAHTGFSANRSSITFANDWDDRIWKNSEAWEKRHKRKGKWGAGTKEESHIAANTRHEYGHILDGELGNRLEIKRLTMTKEFNEMRRKVFKDDKFPSSAISNYAGKNPKEWFAEAFTTYTAPYYKKGTFPKRLENFIEKEVLDKIRK